MADLNWKYAKNIFLTATDQQRGRMMRIGSDHVAKLTAKLGSPADPDVQVCLNRAQPLFDAFQNAMVVFDVRSGTRKGQTEVVSDLLKELASERIKQWDITVQNTFLAGTPDTAEGLVVTPGTGGTALADWGDAALAARNYVDLQIVGVDADFRRVETVTQSVVTLIGLPASSTIRVRIISVNDAGEAPPSEVVEFVTPVNV